MTGQAESRQSLHPPRALLESAFQLLRRARIPQVPDIVLSLRNELKREEPDLAHVSDLIAQDLAMTAQVLKTINSLPMGARTPVNSIRQAVSLIGIKRLASLVTAEVFKRLLDSRQSGARLILDFIREQAQAAMALSALSADLEPEESYLFGMLQSAGCLIFADLNQDYANEWAIHTLVSPSRLLDCEHRLFKTDHPTIGFLLAGVWHLPESMTLAIYQQHTQELPSACEDRLRALVAVAQLGRVLMALRRGIEDNPELLDRRDWALAELNTTLPEWERLSAQLLATQPFAV